MSQTCQIFDVSPSGYYAARTRGRRRALTGAASAHLKDAFTASGRTYGSRRQCVALKHQGLSLGRHLVSALMRANCLRPVWKRKFMHTIDSR